MPTPPPYQSQQFPSQSSPIHISSSARSGKHDENAALYAKTVSHASYAHTKLNGNNSAADNNWCDDEKIHPIDLNAAKKAVKRQTSRLEIEDLNDTHSYSNDLTQEKIRKLEEAKKKEVEDLELKKIELEYKLIERQHLLEIELLKKKLEETERAMTSIIAKMDAIPPQQKVS